MWINFIDDWEILEGEVYCGLRIGLGLYGMVYRGIWYGMF